jgi:hypothetical protein
MAASPAQRLFRLYAVQLPEPSKEPNSSRWGGLETNPMEAPRFSQESQPILPGATVKAKAFYGIREVISKPVRRP